MGARDASELKLLAAALKRDWGSRGVVLMGHSTGAQDCVRYAQRWQESRDGAADLLGVVLQAGCSDREGAMFLDPEATRQNLAVARSMAEAGRGDEAMPRGTMFDRAPITADRYLSLYERLGDDDMFSADLTDAEMSARLGHLGGVPALVLLSGADEFMPPEVDKARHGEVRGTARGRRQGTGQGRSRQASRGSPPISSPRRGWSRPWEGPPSTRPWSSPGRTTGAGDARRWWWSTSSASSRGSSDVGRAPLGLR